MKLTATPFDPTTGTLLPVYRDAYLRGDLSRRNNTLVDAYLKSDRQLSDEALLQFYALRAQGEQVQPVGWVGRQMELIRTEPRRFRQRAATLVAAAALVAGASMATTVLPHTSTDLPHTITDNPVSEPGAGLASTEAVGEASRRMITLRGRILNENGRPLVGATVLHKASGRGVGTNANGEYVFTIPASLAGSLQYGYAGYEEEVIAFDGTQQQTVTLLPRESKNQKSQGKKHRWLFF